MCVTIEFKRLKIMFQKLDINSSFFNDKFCLFEEESQKKVKLILYFSYK
jgi:hypothetical protein